MRVGVFTALLAQLPLEEVLKKLKSLNVSTVELGTGNYPGDPHCKLSMLDSRAELTEFEQMLSDYGVIHQRVELPRQPAASQPGTRQARPGSQPQNGVTCRKAGRAGGGRLLRVPGRSPTSQAAELGDVPVAARLPGNSEMAVGEEVEPYWTKHGAFAADHGVKIAIEMHPGFVVYSPETMLRLRAIAGKSVGCNYDPSHMFWQGIDPIAAIRCLAIRSITSTRKTHRSTSATCRSRACSIPSRTLTKRTAPGFSAPSATATARNGGANSFRRCACTATITCSRSSTKTA